VPSAVDASINSKLDMRPDRKPRIFAPTSVEAAEFCLLGGGQIIRPDAQVAIGPRHPGSNGRFSRFVFTREFLRRATGTYEGDDLLPELGRIW
jgi:hypothetical protein